MNILKRRRLRILFVLWVRPLVLALIVAPSLVMAQSGSPKKDPRKQTLNFEDELVEGAAEKPEIFYLFQKKNFNYKRLIKLRENFLPEMRMTSENIQRSRREN